ncbi:peroxiredoxin [Haloferula luteola]|uniref:Peroxiredoxin n=1 Tax=Haloferula luteola TaxID=595692 RepID=A0A840VF32_9BACT|nr:redoxin domain-containing protein [Haloferula luteola]MBB5351421.1 peroxiredoxin [Haloferula luteola]
MKTPFSLVALAAAALSVASALALEPGEKAPSFTLESASGKQVSLEDYAGKTVVLEWVNFDCPFVKKHYSSGNMPSLQEKYTTEGVVWLTVQSGPEGKLPSASQLEEKAEAAGNKATAVLRDPAGVVGKSYGAETTPHLFVINDEGEIAYMGGIDDKPDLKKESLETATNYVAAALDSLAEEEEVAVKKAAPYGCGVKY